MRYQFEAGLTDFQNVLDAAQRSLLSFQERARQRLLSSLATRGDYEP
jgi:hypothetical protein